MSKPLRLVPAVPVELPEHDPAPRLNDYDWRQEATVKALLMALGLKEVPDAVPDAALLPG